MKIFKMFNHVLNKNILAPFCAKKIHCILVNIVLGYITSLFVNMYF